jgi:hypothetical protein
MTQEFSRETAENCEDIRTEIQTMYFECELATSVVNRRAQSLSVYLNGKIHVFHDSAKQSLTDRRPVDHQASVNKTASDPPPSSGSRSFIYGQINM